MGLVRQAAALLFIIAIPVALITTTVRIVANEPRLYTYAIDHYDAPQRSGIARDDLLRGSRELREYFNNDEEEIFVRVEQDGRPIPLFNSRETAHLRDVKTLFQTSFRVQEGAVIFILVYVVGVFIWAREGGLRALATQVLLAGLLGLAVIAGVGAFAVTGFDQSFEQFHLIAFDNDLWRLDPSRDHLLQMFPEAFWRDVSLWVGAATFVELASLVVGSGLYLLFSKRPEVAYTLPKGAQPQVP